MDAQFSSLPTWLDVASELVGNVRVSDAEDVVFVDVGGGNGSQLAALKKVFPDLKGRMILQDRPDVLSRAVQVDGMEKMPYDFETEQPVKSESLPCRGWEGLLHFQFSPLVVFPAFGLTFYSTIQVLEFTISVK